MSARTFFSTALPPPGSPVELADDEAFHAVNVLRLAAGDAVRLLDGHGGRAEGRISQIAKAGRRFRVTVEIVSREQVPLPACRLHLYVAPPRAKPMAHVVRASTELGVWVIHPVICRFSVSRPDPADSWQPEAVAAAKQSGNPFLPAVSPPADFAAALDACRTPGWFGAVVPEGRGSLGQPTPAAAVGDLALWIGPEGGFCNEELDALIGKGFDPLRVGPCILRVETAVAAAIGWLYGRGCLA